MFIQSARTFVIVLVLTQISCDPVDKVIGVLQLIKDVSENVSSTRDTINPVDEVAGVLQLIKDVSQNVGSTWDIINKIYNGRIQEALVLTRLAQISRYIEKLESKIDGISSVALMIIKNNREKTRLELRLHEMADLLSRVTSADRLMREYFRIQQTLEKSTLQDFAEWTVSHSPTALPGLLERIHSLIVPPHKHLLGIGLMQLLLEDVQEEGSDVCALQMSPHQLIYDIYNTIALTEIKGYAMMQFSWMLLRIYGKGNFTQEASLTRQRYGQRVSESAQVVRNALAVANRDIYKCNPSQHVEGETFNQVTRLLQGYIENEVDMNADGSCGENCAYYTLANNYGCFKEKFCAKQKICKGRIIDCQYIDSDMMVCPAWSRYSNRRYEWIQYENGKTLGKYGSCMRGTTQVDSWWRWLFWHCSYCMCLCDDATDSDRYFSLWDTTSDVNNNKVVTGIRLVKHGRVFHLQIHDGTLKERGFVEAGDWVPVQEFDPLDLEFKEDVDYHTLTYERRAIDLDELDSPEGSVLTGVRFKVIGAHLHFEIRSTPFNYTTGRLSPQKSQWISNDNTEGSQRPRTKLELYKPDIPTESRIPLTVDSEHDQYLEFTHSDLEADAAQSTVPFIDVQPVLPGKGSTLISGAGIIHRGAKNSGGFVAVKLITYPYGRHVKAEQPPEELVELEEVTEPIDFMPIIN